MSPHLEMFFETYDIPIHCNVLHATLNDAVNTPRGDMQLGFCCDCGHIYNFAFDPKCVQYTGSYENSLHFSPHFQNYAESLARNLVERYDLRGKDIIEIGCGKGEFLKLLCELGDNRGLGFDASYVAEDADKSSRERFTVIRDLYSERYANHKADFIYCRHVLEHIHSPRDFLSTVRQSIGNRVRTVVFFEVPNVLFTLKDLGIWDLIYEHCSYFSSTSLSRLFASCGFEILNLKESYGGQFLGVESTPSNSIANSTSKPDIDLDKMSSVVSVFAHNYRDKVQTWRRNFEHITSTGKRTVVWGAGSKGITFLNTLGINDQIEYIIDINPRKQGKYTAGTGQKVVAPEILREYKPDVVIVMNPIYKDEIRQFADNLGLRPEYMYC